MKKGILFLLLLATVAASAQEKKQSLKDLLYGGKLKMDSNSVIRKGDDLASKIDTTTKKPIEPEKPKSTTVALDPAKNADLKSDTSSIAVVQATGSDTNAEIVATTTTVPAKSNSKVLKEYTQSLIAGLTTEVMSSKKIKKETYYVTVDYELGTEGQFTVTGVTSSPENEFLQGQVRDRIESAPPQLSPSLDSNGKARKQKKRHSFSITKE
jgi:hypothetical protein